MASTGDFSVVADSGTRDAPANRRAAKSA